MRRAAAAQRSEPLSVESGDPGIDPVRAEIDVLGHQSLEPRRRQIGKRRDRRLGVGGVLDWRGFDRSVRSGRGEHPVGKWRRAAGKAEPRRVDLEIVAAQDVLLAADVGDQRIARDHIEEGPAVGPGGQQGAAFERGEIGVAEQQVQ